MHRWSCKACAEAKGVLWDRSAVHAVKGYCGLGEHHTQAPLRFIDLGERTGLEGLDDVLGEPTGVEGLEDVL